VATSRHLANLYWRTRCITSLALVLIFIIAVRQSRKAHRKLGWLAQAAEHHQRARQHLKRARGNHGR